jgi:quercetin dioxygenase-like cupin family protein
MSNLEPIPNAPTAHFLTADQAEKARCFGVSVDILLTGKETGGAFSSYRIRATKGAGAPLHLHDNEEESFHIISGTFRIQYGETTVLAEPGSTVFFPRHVPHTFECVTDTAEAYGICTPAGHDAFFRETTPYVAPPPMEEAIALCARHGIRLLPPVP